jgi:transcriptional regulator with XRE-family HTH domain
MRAFRRRRGMTQEVLAGLTGLTAAYVSMIENGKRPLDRYSLIVTLAGALGVPPAELAPGMPAGAVGQPAGPAGGKRVIQALDLIAGRDTASAADSLTELVEHYSYAVCAVPPGVVYDELLTVRSYADAIIEGSGRGSRRSDLVLAMGWLSSLLAVAACDLGEHAAARLWCADSVRQSEDCGNPEPGA